MAERKRKILFVCLGNICRSPMAMAIFNNLTDESWVCDSAALGPWHIGKPPDSRAVSTLKSFGITLQHSARQVIDEDFRKFDLIMGMDHDNIASLRKMAPRGTDHKIELITKYDPEGADIVPDPYYLKPVYPDFMGPDPIWITENPVSTEILHNIIDADFRNCHYIMAMNRDDLASLKKMAPRGTDHNTREITMYDSGGTDCVPDPYDIIDADFRNCHYIMAMNRDDLASLKKMAPRGTDHNTREITMYDSGGTDCVPDPYDESGAEGFIKCYKVLERSIKNFLRVQ